MIINHTDNNALFSKAIDRSNCKPLMNKLHECFQLFKKVNDPETKDALYLAVSEAVELAEDNAFDRAAELQAAITTDELSIHEAPRAAAFDPSGNPSTDDIAAQLPDYFGNCKPLDAADGIDPSAGIILQFQDMYNAKTPSTELKIIPAINAYGKPVLDIAVDRPQQ